MKTSLLVPCYNAAQQLPRLWETVRAQVLPFDEWICFDDASSDNTAEVARALGATVIRSDTNCGPARARNQLWHAAQGDLVHFHDADDLLAPTYLKRTVERMTPSTDLVICNVDWVAENDLHLVQAYRYSGSELSADPVSYTIENPIGGINGLYRKDALRSVGGFNEQMRNWEDADIHIRLALKGARFGVLEETLCTSLRSGNSVSTNYPKNWRYRLTALEQYAQIMPSRARPALAREAERAALNLVAIGATDSAKAAIRLTRQLGGNPPSSGRWPMQCAKQILPALWLLRLQARARHIV
jgi:glycosyltransferase involved in cell wall biosynthesis